jgi:hypothetical protein
MVTFEKNHIAFMGNQNGNILISNSIFSRACMRELNLKKEIGIATRMK